VGLRSKLIGKVPTISYEALLPDKLFELGAGIAIGLLVAWVYVLLWKVRYTALVRGDAVQRSLAVTAGKVHEQLIAYLPGFPYNPKDVRFLGGPVDLVVFDGLAEGRLRRIVFMEVKTGGSTLTARERDVRDVVQSGEVEWAELRVARPVASGAA
jgi:Endonuclease related to archaeal Holliday junction resolvase